MKKLLVCASLLGALGLAPAALARDDPGVKIGTLSCHVRAGVGLIVAGSRSMHCRFAGANGSMRYNGRITNIGVDVGYHGPSDLVWAVFAPSDRVGPGALDGHYGGVSAGAAVGFGAGANALVGGSDRTVVLQPLSVSANTGLSANAGIGGMSLDEVHGTYEPA
ncbi:MAG TPA: DUF992 domain-containing protein [Caulobacteraceae bacterium]|nr:DUF992 domain-containing protein [Caulobacteraceae bacterium]